MWKESVRFICRYLAIGVLVGIGIYAIDEIHWRLFGSERAEMVYQSIDRLTELQHKLVAEPPVNHVERDESASLPSRDGARRTDVIRPTPYFVNGGVQGYRLYPGRDRQEFLSLGLRPGDLVTEIDGQHLGDSTVARELFAKAGSGQPVILTILRGGEPERIEVNVD